jgi:hypothetical protein
MLGTASAHQPDKTASRDFREASKSLVSVARAVSIEIAQRTWDEIKPGAGVIQSSPGSEPRSTRFDTIYLKLIFLRSGASEYSHSIDQARRV